MSGHRLTVCFVLVFCLGIAFAWTKSFRYGEGIDFYFGHYNPEVGSHNGSLLFWVDRTKTPVFRKPVSFSNVTAFEPGTEFRKHLFGRFLLEYKYRFLIGIPHWVFLILSVLGYLLTVLAGRRRQKKGANPPEC